MSEVVSLRLKKDNPREAIPWHVLQARIAKGYNIHHIITETLIRLEQPPQELTSVAIDELNKTLNQVHRLHKQIGNGKPLFVNNQRESQADFGLSTSFVLSVRKSVKSGLKLD